MDKSEKLMLLRTFILLITYVLDVYTAPLINEVTEDFLDERECLYQGKYYSHSSSIETEEPCLNCTCNRGVLVCFLRVCHNLVVHPDSGCRVEKSQGKCCSEMICDADGAKENKLIVRNTTQVADITTPSPAGRLEGTTATNGADSMASESGFAEETAAPSPTEFSISDNSAKLGCWHNGSLYAEGSAMPSSSFCEYCYCIRGHQRCIRPQCHLHIDECRPVYHNDFSCCPTAYKCSKRSGGTASTTTTTTTTTTRRPLSSFDGNTEHRCLVNGTFYKDGDAVSIEDICQNCFCLQGEVRCSTVICALHMDGCVPIIQDGKCCPTGYNCTAPPSKINDIFSRRSDENYANDTTEDAQTDSSSTEFDSVIADVDNNSTIDFVSNSAASKNQSSVSFNSSSSSSSLPNVFVQRKNDTANNSSLRADDVGEQLPMRYNDRIIVDEDVNLVTDAATTDQFDGPGVSTTGSADATVDVSVATVAEDGASSTTLGGDFDEVTNTNDGPETTSSLETGPGGNTTDTNLDVYGTTDGSAVADAGSNSTDDNLLQERIDFENITETDLGRSTSTIGIPEDVPVGDVESTPAEDLTDSNTDAEWKSSTESWLQSTESLLLELQEYSSDDKSYNSSANVTLFRRGTEKTKDGALEAATSSSPLTYNLYEAQENVTDTLPDYQSTSSSLDIELHQAWSPEAVVTEDSVVTTTEMQYLHYRTPPVAEADENEISEPPLNISVVNVLLNINSEASATNVTRAPEETGSANETLGIASNRSDIQSEGSGNDFEFSEIRRSDNESIKAVTEQLDVAEETEVPTNITEDDEELQNSSTNTVLNAESSEPPPLSLTLQKENVTESTSLRLGNVTDRWESLENAAKLRIANKTEAVISTEIPQATPNVNDTITNPENKPTNNRISGNSNSTSTTNSTALFGSFNSILSSLLEKEGTNSSSNATATENSDSLYIEDETTPLPPKLPENFDFLLGDLVGDLGDEYEFNRISYLHFPDYNNETEESEELAAKTNTSVTTPKLTIVNVTKASDSTPAPITLANTSTTSIPSVYRNASSLEDEDAISSNHTNTTSVTTPPPHEIIEVHTSTSISIHQMDISVSVEPAVECDDANSSLIQYSDSNSTWAPTEITTDDHQLPQESVTPAERTDERIENRTTIANATLSSSPEPEAVNRTEVDKPTEAITQTSEPSSTSTLTTEEPEGTTPPATDGSFFESDLEDTLEMILNLSKTLAIANKTPPAWIQSGNNTSDHLLHGTIPSEVEAKLAEIIKMAQDGLVNTDDHNSSYFAAIGGNYSSSSHPNPHLHQLPSIIYDREGVDQAVNSAWYNGTGVLTSELLNQVTSTEQTSAINEEYYDYDEPNNYDESNLSSEATIITTTPSAAQSLFAQLGALLGAASWASSRHSTVAPIENQTEATKSPTSTPASNDSILEDLHHIFIPLIDLSKASFNAAHQAATTVRLSPTASSATVITEATDLFVQTSKAAAQVSRTTPAFTDWEEPIVPPTIPFLLFHQLQDLTTTAAPTLPTDDGTAFHLNSEAGSQVSTFFDRPDEFHPGAQPVKPIDGSSKDALHHHSWNDPPVEQDGSAANGDHYHPHHQVISSDQDHSNGNSETIGRFPANGHEEAAGGSPGQLEPSDHHTEDDAASYSEVVQPDEEKSYFSLDDFGDVGGHRNKDHHHLHSETSGDVGGEVSAADSKLDANVEKTSHQTNGGGQLTDDPAHQSFGHFASSNRFEQEGLLSRTPVGITQQSEKAEALLGDEPIIMQSDRQTPTTTTSTTSVETAQDSEETTHSQRSKDSNKVQAPSSFPGQEESGFHSISTIKNPQSDDIVTGQLAPGAQVFGTVPVQDGHFHGHVDDFNNVLLPQQTFIDGPSNIGPHSGNGDTLLPFELFTTTTQLSATPTSFVGLMTKGSIQFDNVLPLSRRGRPNVDEKTGQALPTPRKSGSDDEDEESELHSMTVTKGDTLTGVTENGAENMHVIPFLPEDAITDELHHDPLKPIPNPNEDVLASPSENSESIITSASHMDNNTSIAVRVGASSVVQVLDAHTQPDLLGTVGIALPLSPGREETLEKSTSTAAAIPSTEVLPMTTTVAPETEAAQETMMTEVTSEPSVLFSTTEDIVSTQDQTESSSIQQTASSTRATSATTSTSTITADITTSTTTSSSTSTINTEISSEFDEPSQFTAPQTPTFTSGNLKPAAAKSHTENEEHLHPGFRGSPAPGIPPAPEYCVENGEVFQDGERIPTHDFCAQCRCNKGEIKCQHVSCPRRPPNCAEKIVPSSCCPAFVCSDADTNGDGVEDTLPLRSGITIHGGFVPIDGPVLPPEETPPRLPVTEKPAVDIHGLHEPAGGTTLAALPAHSITVDEPQSGPAITDFQEHGEDFADHPGDLLPATEEEPEETVDEPIQDFDRLQPDDGSSFLTTQPPSPISSTPMIATTTIDDQQSFLSSLLESVFGGGSPGEHAAGEPEMEFAAGEPEMEFAAGEPEMEFAAGEPEMEFAAGTSPSAPLITDALPNADKGVSTTRSTQALMPTEGEESSIHRKPTHAPPTRRRTRPTVTTTTTTERNVEDETTTTTKPIRQPSASGSSGLWPSLLKVSGCNIYGRVYQVGSTISVLSGPCKECKCSATGVECYRIKCF